MKIIRKSLTFTLLLLVLSCSEDEPNSQEGSENPENSDIQFEDNDISFNLVNLKWSSVTGPNNETLVYDVYLGDTKIKDSNTDTDYTLTRLEANTSYTGRIIPKTVDANRTSNKVAAELSPIPFSVTTKQFADPDAPTPEISNISTNSVTKTGATLNWDTATISDNSQITYNIYLEGDLAISNLTDTSFIFENLDPNTLYKGVLLAISSNQKSIAIDFEFTTLLDPDEIPLTGITFFRGSETSFFGRDWLQLIPIFAPINANQVDLNWTSSDETIATVDKSGYVNTKNIGVTVITATFADNPDITQSIELTVTVPRPIDAKFISTQPKRSSLLTGDSRKIKINKFGIETGSADDSFTFTSSDPSVASVDTDGNITAITEGTVAITVTSTVDATITSSLMLRVVSTSILPTNFVFFSESPLSLFTGQSQNVYPVIEPEDTTNKDIIFTSTNTSIIEVNPNGSLAKAVGVGNASVIVTSVADNSLTAVREFVVIQDPISYDDDAGIYKAPPSSDVDLRIYSNIDADPNVATASDVITILINYSVKNKNGEELIDPAKQETIISSNIFIEPDYSYAVFEDNSITFTMPTDGEVTINTTITIIDDPVVLGIGFSSLDIYNTQGPRKTGFILNTIN